ncbi:hypothetical protein [Frigidibacter sp. SD6-1]|uniref:hypothetical protein n=1 Tax=Frigidibacter sp. SD6-1 TaxID=3032581 RepID=UPI0024E01361|nr:hypothetical protein [Frigidibacter sp. SD6-1]
MQGRLGPDGPVVLVTLPCPLLTVGIRRTDATEPHGLLSQARGRALLKTLGLADPGPFTLSANMPRGGGGGVSTAALVALARLAGSRHGAMELASACVGVEGASDPLMFDRPEQMLWASRRGEVMRDLPALPAMEVVGGFFGPNRRTNAADENFADIADLIDPWEAAARTGDLPALAALTSESARRNRALRGPAEDPTPGLCHALGALGHTAAHTGSARGLIFAPGQAPKDATARLHAAGFRRVVTFRTGGDA